MNEVNDRMNEWKYYLANSLTVEADNCSSSDMSMCSEIVWKKTLNIIIKRKIKFYLLFSPFRVKSLEKLKVIVIFLFYRLLNYIRPNDVGSYRMIIQKLKLKL